jgi:hypothetical protein
MEMWFFQGCLFEDGPYRGGDKATPRLEIERLNFISHSMPSHWEKHKKIVRYYCKDNNKDDSGIKVKV